MRPGANGTVSVVPGFARRLLYGRAAAENDQVGERDLLCACLRVVEVFPDLLEALEDQAQLRWVVDLPVALWLPGESVFLLGPPRLSVPRKLAAAAQAVVTS